MLIAPLLLARAKPAASPTPIPGTTSCPPVRQPTTRTYGRLWGLCSQTRERGAYSIRPTVRPDAMPSRLEDPRGVRTVDMIEFSSGRIAGGCGSTARVVGRARLAATALVARRASTAHPASRARCGAAAAQGIGDAGADRKDASAARRPTARDSTVGCPVRLLASLASRRRFAFVTYSRRAVRPGSRGAGGCCRQRLRFAPPNAKPHRQHRNARVSPRTRRAIRGRNGAPERQSQDASLVGALRSRGCCWLQC